MIEKPKYIFIIESLNDPTGIKMRDQLRLLIKRLIIKHEIKYFDIKSKYQFFNALEVIKKSCEGNFITPAIHFSMHGDKEGVYLKNSEHILFNEICEHLSDIKFATSDNLLITMEVCKGAKITSALNPNSPIPFAGVFGAKTDIDYWEPIEGFIGFYTKFITSSDLKQSISQFRRSCPQCHRKFHYTTKKQIGNLLEKKRFENFKTNLIKRFLS